MDTLGAGLHNFLSNVHFNSLHTYSKKKKLISAKVAKNKTGNVHIT
jgi:hypothetical protein